MRTVVTEVDRKVLEIFNGEEEAALKNTLRRLYMQSIEEIIQV